MLNPTGSDLLTDVRNRVASELDRHVGLITSLAVLNSGSVHPEGVGRVQNVLADALRTLGAVMRLEYPDPIDTVDHHGTSRAVGIGPLLHAIVRPDEPRRVMVAGHADTVFGPDHGFQEVRRDGDLLHGPGVADMKGGLVALLAALEVILERDLAPDLGIEVVISGDEETGSPSSIPTLNAVGRRACAALVVEPRMVGGGVARARAGSANLTFMVTGRSAHASTFADSVALLVGVIDRVATSPGIRPGVG